MWYHNIFELDWIEWRRTACQVSWVSVHPPSANTAALLFDDLPEPTTTGNPNPLHGADFAPNWHVVYAGITPGVYGSYLECALNTIGLSCASYQSASSLAEAEEYWRKAQAQGHERSLNHDFYSVST
ncbi:hypothetical protein C8R46DRAFT_1239366 [Mycena filopes]|nr:hypothetical protein C8R46DRAFT_1239366 [Mycena filopes]